jgi:hypothetical protein
MSLHSVYSFSHVGAEALQSGRRCRSARPSDLPAHASAIDEKGKSGATGGAPLYYGPRTRAVLGSKTDRGESPPSGPGKPHDTRLVPDGGRIKCELLSTFTCSEASTALRRLSFSLAAWPEGSGQYPV